MGQIVTTAEQKRLVESNIRAYVEQVTGSYSRLFGRSPTFVTYYSLDLDSGGHDTNLGGATQVVGYDSPLRYKEVASFPLYGVGEADLQRAYDEVTGVTTGEVEGEAYVLPGAAEPCENDFFRIEHLDTPLLFRVREVTPDRIEGKTFFRVSYYLDESSAEEIKSQVSGEYEYDMRNVGTDVSPVVSKATTLALRELEAVTEVLKEQYWRQFFDREAGTVMLRRGSPSGAATYDRAVELFLHRTGVLSGSGYLSSRVVRARDFSDQGAFEDGVYRLTPYMYAERGDWPDSDAQVASGMLVGMNTATDPWHPFYGMFGFDEDYAEVLNVLAGSPGSQEATPGFAAAMRLADLGEAGETKRLALVARKCLAGRYRGVDAATAREGIMNLASDLNDDEVIRDRAAMFWLLPIALHEAKRLRESREVATLD